MAIKVSGTCQPEKCGGACCKGWDSDPSQLKLSKIKGLKSDGWVCEHLTKDNTCAIYPNRPECCKKFPLITPELYAIVKTQGCTLELVEEDDLEEVEE